MTPSPDSTCKEHALVYYSNIEWNSPRTTLAAGLAPGEYAVTQLGAVAVIGELADGSVIVIAQLRHFHFGVHIQLQQHNRLS